MIELFKADGKLRTARNARNIIEVLRPIQKAVRVISGHGRPHARRKTRRPSARIRLRILTPQIRHLATPQILLRNEAHHFIGIFRLGRQKHRVRRKCGNFFSHFAKIRLIGRVSKTREPNARPDF